MKKFALSSILLLFLCFVLVSFPKIKMVRASGTIYIRSDGTVEGTDKIQRDGDVYTFTESISNEIVVERSNTIVDGASYTLQGTGSGDGFSWLGINNVTVKNIEIKDFDYGISLVSSSNYNSISGNNITNNRGGVRLDLSSNYNSISGNNIITNNGYGVLLRSSSNNSISGNNITANKNGGVGLDLSSNYNSISGNNITAHNWGGVALGNSSNYNSISGNNIANNGYGVALESSSNNEFYHNKFIGNTRQVYDYSWDYPEMISPSVNVWDEGYPSGGNYWSDYEERYPGAGEIDGSSVWNTPYVIDKNNQDNYPLINPLEFLEEEIPLWMQWWFWTILGLAIVALVGAVFLFKKRKPQLQMRARISKK